MTNNESNVTMEYENFCYYSTRLQIAGVLGDVHVELSKLKSANSRFMFTRALLRKHKMLISKLDIDTLYDHPDTSTRYRQNGNALFRAQFYSEAANMYTMGIMRCNPKTECYALTQANRSAAYFRMGQYEQCLNDAFCAVQTNHYPPKLAYKLYERMGHAKRILGLVELAKESYAMCLKRLNEADMSAENKCKFRAVIEKFVTECEKLPTERKIPKETPSFEQLVGGKNENIPALSAFVELKMSENMGRGVYATRDINPGDVVAIDKPYICGPFTEYAGVCNYNGCMKIELNTILCPKCLLVSYCNKDCMIKDDKDGHHLVCPIIYFIRSTPGIPTTNELAMKWFLKDYLKMGLKKYCLIVDNFSESKIDPIIRGFDEIGQYKSDNFLTAYSLETGKNKISLDILFFYNCIAVDLLHYLILSGLKIPECYIGTVGASLVHILTILDLNYRKSNLDPLSFQRIDLLLSHSVALTLYPSISLFNHSCDANISPSGNMFDRIRVMKAIQPIPKGTQLCCTYGIMFKSLNKEQRQTFCNNCLKFKCYCEPCIKDWPTNNYIPNRLSTLNILNYSMIDTVSSECKKFVEFSKSVDPKDHCQHLNYLYSFIKLLYTNVKRPFSFYEDCLEMISNAHFISTNVKEYL